MSRKRLIQPKSQTSKQKRRPEPYLFIAPAVILLVLFAVLPIVIALGISFTDMDLRGISNWSNISFIGWRITVFSYQIRFFGYRCTIPFSMSSLVCRLSLCARLVQRYYLITDRRSCFVSSASSTTCQRLRISLRSLLSGDFYTMFPTGCLIRSFRF